MRHIAINVTLIVLFFLAASLAERLAAAMSGAKGRAAGAVSLSSLRGLGRVGNNNKFKGA